MPCIVFVFLTERFSHMSKGCPSEIRQIFTEVQYNPIYSFGSQAAPCATNSRYTAAAITPSHTRNSNAFNQASNIGLRT